MVSQCIVPLCFMCVTGLSICVTWPIHNCDVTFGAGGSQRSWGPRWSLNAVGPSFAFATGLSIFVTWRLHSCDVTIGAGGSQRVGVLRWSFIEIYSWCVCVAWLNIYVKWCVHVTLYTCDRTRCIRYSHANTACDVFGSQCCWAVCCTCLPCTRVTWLMQCIRKSHSNTVCAVVGFQCSGAVFCMCDSHYTCGMGWLRSVGSIKL